jgi:hypothetical protein
VTSETDLRTGDRPREINLAWIHAGNMMNDNTNRAPVRGRCRCAPFSVRNLFRKSRQAGSTFFDASSQRFRAAACGTPDIVNGWRYWWNNRVDFDLCLSLALVVSFSSILEFTSSVFHICDPLLPEFCLSVEGAGRCSSD